MKVIVKAPGMPGELQEFPDEINDKLRALQMAVGGGLSRCAYQKNWSPLWTKKGA